jgi:hypothetical protein
MPLEEIPAFLGQLAQIEGYARARLKALVPPKPAPKERPRPTTAILTVDEVAEALVAQLVREGKLATVRLPGARGAKGRQVRVLAAEPPATEPKP